MAKAKKTELQQAADRVDYITRAVEKSEANLKICQDDFDKAWLAVEEARRNLNDTAYLLAARKASQQMEVAFTAELLKNANKKYIGEG